MVVVVAFLVSLSTKFANTSSGMYLGGRFQVCKSILKLQAEIELYLSPTTHLQLSKTFSVKQGACAATGEANQCHASSTKAHITCTIFKFN